MSEITGKPLFPVNKEDRKTAKTIEQYVRGGISPVQLIAEHRALGFRQGVERCKAALLAAYPDWKSECPECKDAPWIDALHAMRELKP
jgi:hypothetical protein